jgi:hypothetical protein
MGKSFLVWLVGKSTVERLLVAATVVAALRMMLIHGVFIGFNLAGWAWFGPVEVFSGLAFAVLEGKALAYVSRLWVGLRPKSLTDWVYWSVLAVGQMLLLGSIVGVTAFAATSVRRETGIDLLLGDTGAVAWSMFVTGLNPLMVMLIGIARGVDPGEIQQSMNTRTGAKWMSVDDEARLFAGRWQGPVLTPPDLVREFERAAGVVLSVEEAEVVLSAGSGKSGIRSNGKG